MNAILEQINSAGLIFVKFALPMLVQSSILIAVLLLADVLLRKKVRAVFRYWLWMLVLIKLVLPTTLSSPVSLGSWFGDKLASIKVNDTSIVAQPVNMLQVIETETVPAAVSPQPDIGLKATPPLTVEPVTAEAVMSPAVSMTPLIWQGIVFMVWAVIVAVMGLLLLQRAIFVSGLVAQAQNPPQLMNDAFNFCCRQMGIKRKVGLKVSANTASPAVCGLFRPMILVPENLAPTLGSSRLRMVFLHELAHIKRGDLWINLVQTILQIIYFYNPLLWLANFIIRRIREQAVDEAVQAALGTNAHQYPQTLVDVAKIAFNRPVLSLRLIGVVESKSALKGRIERMLNRPVPKTAKLGFIGLIALMIFAVVVLPMAKAKSKSPEFIIKGIVTDAKTGQPIAGAKVGDDKYAGGQFWTTTDSNGHYSYNTWYEEHNIKCEASGYKTQNTLFGTKLFNSEKQKVIDFALEPSRHPVNIDYSSVTVKEGVGFDDILVGNPKCTGEFIKSKLGEPDEETKNEKDWWLVYHKTYGLDFWVNPKENVLIEIRLNKGFNGKLTSGISMSSTKQEVFDAYGQPFNEEVAEDFDNRFDNQVLLFRKPAWAMRWRKPTIAKIYYNGEGLLFWFDGDTINQIVISQPVSEQELIEGKKQQPTDIDTKKKEILKKLVVLNEHRDRVQRDLDAAERGLGEVRERWNISGLEDNSYVDPIIERFNRLQRERDDCALEISKVKARVENLKKEAQTEQEKKYLKDTENLLVELQAKFDELEKMRTEAAKRKAELDLARIQYRQRATVRDERLQRLNEAKAQIEQLKLEYENPEVFGTPAKVDIEGAGKVTDKDKMASENLAAQGWELWRQRKLAEAEEAFEKAVSKDPTNANAWNGLGWAQQNQSKPLNAKASFEKCLEIQPKHAAALNGLGWIAKAQGKTDEAIAHWEKAIEAAPTATAALNGLATTYMELKQFDKAAEYYRMWLKVEPDNADAKAGLEKAKSQKTNPQASIEPVQQNPLNEAVYTQLDLNVDLSGLTPNMPFGEAIALLKNSVDPPLKIVVLWQALYDNADIDQSTPINIDAIPSTRLGTALKLLLKSVSNFAELDYAVEDGIIYIATIESLPAKFETRVYDISDLISNTASVTDIARVIIRTVEPERWDSTGGEGTVDIYDNKLVFYQTAEIHKQIQDVLQELRNSSSKKDLN
jgi:bla regulator protein BlaR1